MVEKHLKTPNINACIFGSMYLQNINNMQNEVQTIIKIATEVKESADTQKNAKLKLEICLQLRLSGKCRFNARSVV